MKNKITLLVTASALMLGVEAMAWTPKKRALLEEYTGTWCGWCPRGFVGLERLNELMGDECVSVSFHNKDVMTFADGYSKKYPETIGGFPAAYIDRKTPTDAYAGNGWGRHFGIDTTYVNACNEPAAGEISCKAYFTGDAQTTVNCDVTVRFPDSHTDSPYQLGFILTADSLSGESSEWDQVSYYSSMDLGRQYTDDDMKAFVDGGYRVKNLVYNFVVVGYSGPDWIDGSLPRQVEADQSYTYTYAFDLSKDNDHCKASIIQHKDKLKCVAVLIDSSTGYVDNAIKVPVTTEQATGVRSLPSTAAADGGTAYYTLGGARIQQPRHGVTIQRKADGSAMKVFRK